MGARPRDHASRLLIVEGLDDQYVAEALLRREGIDVPFTAVPKRSVGALIKGMGAEVKAPGRLAIGFVMDANSDPAARWAEAVEALRDISPIPESPDAAGTIVGSAPKVGIWMMPDNSSQGELEDFVREMVPSGDPVWSLAEAFIGGLPEDARRFAAARPAKAVLHAWLATKRKPGRLATAIKDADLEVGGDLAQRYVLWLRRLFLT